MKLTTLALVAALTAAGGAAWAQAPGPGADARAAVQAACKADLDTLCAGKTGREAMQCLRAAAPDKVSAPCKDAMSKLPARRPPTQQ